MRFIVLAAALLFLTLSEAALPCRAAAAGEGATIDGVFIGSDLKQNSVTLSLPAPFGRRALSVADPAAWLLLSNARPGDILSFSVDKTTDPTRIESLPELQRPVGVLPRIAALAGGILVIWGLGAAMLWRSPVAFLIGTDNRYSNSQTQLALWFTAVASVYFAALILRILYLGLAYTGGIEIPENLLVLTGLSAFSFGGAKVITAQKVANAAQAKPPAVKTPAAQPRLADLVQNDKQQADLGDFEMMLIALAAVGIFGLSGFHFLGELKMAPQVTLPDIDTTLLASFGIGHGAYLVKKASLNLGDG